MKHSIIFAITVLSLSVANSSAGKEVIYDLTDKPLHSQIAVTAVDLSSGQLLYSENPETLMLPASTQKLLTAVAAKLQLPNEFRYSTQLYRKGVVKNGKLDGDLYLSFIGDPTLTSADLNALFKQISDAGLSEVSGNLYLLKEANEQQQAVGWLWNDLGICFAAPVSRFVIDQNCIRGQFKPQKNNHMGVVNFATNLPVTITSTAYFDKTEQEAFCQLELARLPQNQFQINGCYPGSKAINLAIAISDPELYALQTVKRLINASAINITGQVVSTTEFADEVTLIGQHQSAPLDELLRIMLEKSDNLIADSLFKTIGSSYFTQTGSFTNGAAAMRKLLTDAGIDLQYAEIVDGSGLSRYNLLNANQLTQLLQLIYRDQRFHSLIDMLPVAGKTGTLRYKSPYSRAPLKAQVRAKTGSMQGVDNLAGFITTEKHGEISFVILENGQSHQTKQEQPFAFHARILQKLLDKPTK